MFHPCVSSLAAVAGFGYHVAGGRNKGEVMMGTSTKVSEPGFETISLIE
jgi:hypothetical protein